MNTTLTTSTGCPGFVFGQAPAFFVTFTTAAEPTRPTGPPLGEALRMFLDTRVSMNLRPAYIQSLRDYLGMFARGRAWPVTTQDLEDWFQERGERPAVMRPNLGRLSAFFGWCKRRGWLAVNPCDNVEKPRIHLQPPAILTVEHCRRLLDTARARVPSMLPYLVLGLFAGIRPSEIRRLTWADVDLEAGRVVIDGAASKVHRRRVVPLEPLAVEWLRLCDRRAPLVPAVRITFRRHMRKLARLAGHWPQDGLRHTAATYILAKHQDPGRVSLVLGNSERILRRAYCDLIKADDVIGFWGLRP